MSSRSSKLSGTNSVEYKKVLANLPTIIVALQANKTAKDNLCLGLKQQEWIHFADEPSAQDMLKVVLNRIKDEATEYHVFMTLLSRTTGLDLIKKKIQGTGASPKGVTLNYSSTDRQPNQIPPSRDSRASLVHNTQAHTQAEASIHQREKEAEELQNLHSDLQDLQYFFDDLSQLVHDQHDCVIELEKGREAAVVSKAAIESGNNQLSDAAATCGVKKRRKRCAVC